MNSPLLTHRKVAVLLLLHLLLAATTTTTIATLAVHLGINYGQLGDKLPSPSASLKLLRSLNCAHVKLYDANPQILSSLSSTNIAVSPMLPNSLLPNASRDPSFSLNWLRHNLLPFRNTTRLRFLFAGNEVFSGDPTLWPHLVPAMRNLRRALSSLSMHHIKVGTTVAMGALSTSFPPSSSSFRPDLSATIIPDLLHFLLSSRSFYFIDVYPYFVWAKTFQTASLDYALLDPSAKPYTDPQTKLIYRNMLEQQLDAVHFAMKRVGYADVPIVIAETGWPNGGDYDEIGCNAYNAAAYNRNLARWVARGEGTPARPGEKVGAFVFSLFNENMKPGPGTERHWGVFHANGTEVYGLDLTGKTSDERYAPLPRATNNRPYRGNIWCVAAEGAGGNPARLAAAVAYACSEGNSTCDAIGKTGKCYTPDAPLAHASYAFNSYWQQFRLAGGTCFFDGLARQTLVDPSYGSCKFPSFHRRRS